MLFGAVCASFFGMFYPSEKRKSQKKRWIVFDEEEYNEQHWKAKMWTWNGSFSISISIRLQFVNEQQQQQRQKRRQKYNWATHFSGKVRKKGETTTKIKLKLWKPLLYVNISDFVQFA